MARGTRDRILDAAFAHVAEFGIARTSLADVARRASVSRPTLYKHYSNKSELIGALVLREEEQFLQACLEAALPHDDITDALAAAVEAALTLARRHPLLDRLLATEPEALLPYLVGGNMPVVSAVLGVLDEIVAARVPEVAPDVRSVAVDALARVVVSYVVAPPAVPVPTLAAHLAAVLAGGLRAPRTPLEV